MAKGEAGRGKGGKGEAGEVRESMDMRVERDDLDTVERGKGEAGEVKESMDTREEREDLDTVERGKGGAGEVTESMDTRVEREDLDTVEETEWKGRMEGHRKGDTRVAAAQMRKGPASISTPPTKLAQRRCGAAACMQWIRMQLLPSARPAVLHAAVGSSSGCRLQWQEAALMLPLLPSSRC